MDIEEKFFSRHSPLIGEENIKKLRSSTLLIAGLGGLGCTVATLLVRLGIGRLHLVDSDIISPSNLNRQILYHYNDIGKAKVEVAEERLKAINPAVKIVKHKRKIERRFSLPEGIDGVVDFLDNFRSRYILDEFIHQRSIFMVHAGVSTYFGQVTTIFPGKTRSLRDLFPAVPDKVDPVFPPTVLIVASLQAAETVRVLCDSNGKLLNRIAIVDVLTSTCEIIEVKD